MRGDRTFEQQFQWEVDRWVFRHRHRGEPVEVSSEERDRLIERHRARMQYGSRLTGLGIACTIGLAIMFRDLSYLAPIIVSVGMIIGLPLLSYWADNDVTAHLRRRTPIGLPLGLAGRIARRAQALRWRDLICGIAYLAIVIGLTLPTLGTLKAGAIAYLLFEGAIGVLLLWMLLMKWAQRERDRLHDEQIDAIHRARTLGDTEDAGQMIHG